MRKKEFEHGVIYNGDCLDVMPDVIEARSIDMILADLPYNSTAAHWDCLISLEKLWPEYKRILKEKGVSALTGTQPFTSFLVLSNPDMFKYELIWDKVCPVGHLVAYKRVMSVHENILVFYDGQCTYHPQKRRRKKEDLRPNRVNNRKNNTINSGKTELVKNCPEGNFSALYEEEKVFPKSILSFTKRIGNTERIHPTQKPIELFQYLIMTYTNKGDVVLDNVIGSGTTAIAAYNTGRRWIGIEKDPDIFEMACERIEKETRQQHLFN